MTGLTPKQAIKMLRRPGNAYVTARLTPDDNFTVKVDKSYLINLFSQLDKSSKIGFSAMDDGVLYDSYGL